MKVLTILFLLMMSFGAHASPEAAAPLETAGIRYEIYENERFAYLIPYLADLLIPQGESESGDGQRFESPDGDALLLVWGSMAHSIFGQSIEEVYARESADTPNRRVTYRVRRAEWFVVSGFEDGRIFYTKTLMPEGCPVSATFYLVYEEHQRATFDPVIAALVSTFRFTGCRDGTDIEP